MSFLFLKALHLIAVICWFAGLFYLPRLFVYHAMSEDGISNARFKIMEQKLYWGIMTPALLLTVFFGVWMIVQTPHYLTSTWMQLKLTLVGGLVAYHVVCGVFVKTFSEDQNTRSHIFYRWFNEVPVFFLIAIVLLAVIKPFS